MAGVGKGKVGRRKGKKGRKIGRHARHPATTRYKNEKRWIKNKIRKNKRHLKKHPNDKQSICETVA